jgi:D-psicose/D-tagatose/L-ribulose 3-epimerase
MQIGVVDLDGDGLLTSSRREKAEFSFFINSPERKRNMKFGANAFIRSDHFGPEQFPLLPRLKEAGFDGVELPLIEHPVKRDPQLRRELEGIGLECTFCAVLPQGFNTVSDDADVRARTIEHWKACIETVAELGGTILAGPLYAPVGYLPGRRRTADEWKRAVAMFQELGPVLDKYEVSLAIEPLNRYETYFLNTAEDAVKLCREVGHRRVGIMFDTYHANIEEKSLSKAIQTAGEYLRHFHSCENDRGIPGSGHIDWPDVFQALRRVDYDGWLTIEGFGFSLGALSAAVSIWRDLAQTPDSIAFDGVRFLREASRRAERNAS